MGAFNGVVLTNKGQALQAKAQAGATLQYTRIAMGDGPLGGQSIATLNALVSQKKSLSISKIRSLGGGKAVVGAVFTNADITTGFDFKELGVFAQDPDEGEILYCYGNAGSSAEYIPAGGGADIIEKYIDVVTIVGNTATVTAVIDESLVFVSMQEFEDTVGDMSTVPTTSKVVAGAIAELFQSVSDGKNAVASAISGKNVSASGSETFSQLASKISDISNDANAAVENVLAGKTFYQGSKKTGTMTNRGAIIITAGASAQSIPAGYHNGSGSVPAVASLTAANVKAGIIVGGVAGTFTSDANAVASEIDSGKTAYVNGNKITGTSTKRARASGGANSSVGTMPFNLVGGGTVNLPYLEIATSFVPNQIYISGGIGALRAAYYNSLQQTIEVLGTGVNPTIYRIVNDGSFYANGSGFRIPVIGADISWSWVASN